MATVRSVGMGGVWGKRAVMGRAGLEGTYGTSVLVRARGKSFYPKESGFREL